MPDNLIPPFMRFDKHGNPDLFGNLPVYDLNKSDEEIFGTPYKFSDVCSGPFITRMDILSDPKITLRSIDDFFVSYNADNKKMTIWDKQEIPGQIDYVHTEKPPRLSKPMIFEPLIDFQRSPKKLDYDNIKIGYPDHNVYNLIQSMNFDYFRMHTANRFFNAPKKQKKDNGWDTCVLFKIKPMEYIFVTFGTISRTVAYVEKFTYNTQAAPGQRVQSQILESTRGLNELSTVIKNIKRQRDEYVTNQYIH